MRWTFTLFLVILVSTDSISPLSTRRLQDNTETIALPDPQTKGGMALTGVLAQRRSIRSYQEQSLSDSELSQLLWAAQGVTNAEDHRTAPSAGAKYPLELYLVTASAYYHYEPSGHRLTVLGNSDLRGPLEGASQEEVGDAPAVFVVAADYSRTEEKYGNRADRYVEMEAGHACQNLLLQAVALGLGGVSLGAFEDDEVQEVLDLPDHYKPLYVIPIGHPA